MEEKDFERLLRAIYLHQYDSDNPPGIDELCRDNLGIRFEDFVRVGHLLLPLTVPAKSPKTSVYYHSFWVDGVCYVSREADI